MTYVRHTGQSSALPAALTAAATAAEAARVARQALDAAQQRADDFYDRTVRPLVEGATLNGSLAGEDLARLAITMATRSASEDPRRPSGMAWNERPGRGRRAVVMAVGTDATLSGPAADDILALDGQQAALFTLAQNPGAVMTAERLERVYAEADRRASADRARQQRGALHAGPDQHAAQDAGHAIRLMATRSLLPPRLAAQLRARGETVVDLGLAGRFDAPPTERTSLLEGVITRERARLQDPGERHEAGRHVADALAEGIRGGLALARVQELLADPAIQGLVDGRHTILMTQRLQQEAALNPGVPTVAAPGRASDGPAETVQLSPTAPPAPRALRL